VTPTALPSETRHQLDALYDLALELSAERGLEGVLDVALRQCLDLTQSEFGFIGLVRDERAVMDIVAIHGFHPAPAFFRDHRTIPLRPNIFARVVLEDRPVRSDDAATDPARVGQPAGHPLVGSFLGVPLRLDGRPIGMIGVANRPASYEEDHERLTLTYAGLVAVLVRNAELYETLQATNARLEHLVEERTAELASARDALVEKAVRLKAVLADTVETQEQERQRIARDVHDGIGQLLVGAMLELTAAQQRIEAGQVEGAAASMSQVRGILADVESEMRHVVYDLHPPVLEGLGLAAAVREMVERFGNYTGLTAEVTVSGRPARLGNTVEIGLYRVIQEALGNVAAHAHARSVGVAIRFGFDRVDVEVADDGVGFDPAVFERSARLGHLGLESMRRRVESLGGSWRVESAPGRGTTVIAQAPAP
jgi:signal transduction histidine kinase